eukprot:3090545-Rhodomonas_salina.2
MAPPQILSTHLLPAPPEVPGTSRPPTQVIFISPTRSKKARERRLKSRLHTPPPTTPTPRASVRSGRGLKALQCPCPPPTGSLTVAEICLLYTSPSPRDRG